jgi:hypothetical protein
MARARVGIFAPVGPFAGDPPRLDQPTGLTPLRNSEAPTDASDLVIVDRKAGALPLGPIDLVFANLETHHVLAAFVLAPGTKQ